MSTVKGNCASAAYWWLTRGATCGTVICISCFQPPTCDWHMWIKLMTNMSAEGKITPVLGCCENASTEETQYATHVNKFLIALAAVQTSEIVAKKEKKKTSTKDSVSVEWKEPIHIKSSLFGKRVSQCCQTFALNVVLWWMFEKKFFWDVGTQSDQLFFLLTPSESAANDP